MSYITEIFDRLDLQQIREFLLHGVECIQVTDKTYKQRLEAPGKTAFDMLKNQFPDVDEYEKIANDIHHYASVTQDVYMEIGMQCGVALVMKLLNSPKE